MARHICSNCGTVVVDEDFCPKCGAWIDPMGTEAEEGEFEEFSLPAADPDSEQGRSQVVQVPRAEVQCPSCGSPNPATNRHCEECGARLYQGPLPVAPRPAVQATAGVRAAIVISSLLAIVVLVALLVNALSGEPTTTTTTEATAGTEPSDTPPVAAELAIVSVTCSDEGISGFSCENLLPGREGDYEVNWQELVDAGGNVEIQVSFAEPMHLTKIVWSNLQDETRYRRNYRVKTVLILTEDSDLEVPLTLEDEAGVQEHPYETFLTGTSTVVLTVRSVFSSEAVDGNEPFDELAIEGIGFFGYPASETATSP